MVLVHYIFTTGVATYGVISSYYLAHCMKWNMSGITFWLTQTSTHYLYRVRFICAKLEIHPSPSYDTPTNLWHLANATENHYLGFSQIPSGRNQRTVPTCHLKEYLRKLVHQPNLTIAYVTNPMVQVLLWTDGSYLVGQESPYYYRTRGSNIMLTKTCHRTLSYDTWM